MFQETDVGTVFNFVLLRGSNYETTQMSVV